MNNFYDRFTHYLYAAFHQKKILAATIFLNFPLHLSYSP